MVYDIQWSKDAKCLDTDTRLFFEFYEESVSVRGYVDNMCLSCPVKTECLLRGVANKEFGVWSGIYLEDGNISDDLNDHKTKRDWSQLWIGLTMKT